MEPQKPIKIIITIVSIAVVILIGYLVFIKKQGNSSKESASIINSVASDNNSALSNNSALTIGQTQSNVSSATSTAPVIKNNMHIITLKTNYGTIEFTTYDADAPKTVNNFITLAQKGFYDNLIFHRVIDGFMIQGGDPNGNGTGGPGYKFEDELNPQTESYQQGYKKGVVAMANAGPNTNGSQFFIMVADYPLQHNYTIFGKVIKGQEVADKIAKVAKDSNDKPLSPVIMSKVTVK